MRLFVKDIQLDVLQPEDKVNLKSKFVELSYGNFDLFSNQYVFIDDLKQKELRNIIKALHDNDTIIKKLIFRLRKSVPIVDAITKKEFKLIEAAGGIVEKGQKALYIHRLGRWDLPKGKLEKGESIQEGALREVEEECNVKAEIISQLSDTYHIHKYKGKFRIKRTYWFLMRVIGDPVLVPQTEEAIEKVEWLSQKAAKKTVYKDTYNSLTGLLDEYFEL